MDANAAQFVKSGAQSGLSRQSSGKPIAAKSPMGFSSNHSSETIDTILELDAEIADSEAVEAEPTVQRIRSV
jgi:hypothetical protein